MTLLIQKFAQRFLPFYLLLLSNGIVAQQKVVGILKDKKSKEIITFASITNNTTKQTVVSNTNGIFKLMVSKEHLISIAAVGYNFDTLHAGDKQLLKGDTLTIYLQPLTKNLQGVTVTSKGKYNAYQLDSMERRQNYFGTKNSKKQTTFSKGNDGVGLGINLDKLYSKQEKQRSKMIDLYYDMESEEYINYRFNAELVSKYTNLKNEALEGFMEKYRPTAAWLRKHPTEEDVMYYINEKLKEYKQ
jgi:hypothetical protein